jgi:hypothetical protein
VDELGAELDRRRDPGQAARQAATAYSVPCLDKQNRKVGARELRGRGEPRSAGADHQDIARVLL